MREANWATATDVRDDMSYTDLIGGDRFIFNLKGNHYRILVAIKFRIRTVFIQGIFTYAVYDKLTRDDLLTR